jgi:hypothetical protein
MTHSVLRLLTLCLLAAVLTCGCHKLLQTPAPQNEISAGEVFSSDANAQNALAGMYIQIMNNSQSLLNGGMSLYGGLSSDELDYESRLAAIDSFQDNSLNSKNVLCDGLYTTAYNIIFTANSLIAGVDGSTGMSASVKTEMRGEAEFVRALVYFYLVNLYGEVPVVTTTNFAVSSVQPRAAVTAVYAQIVADLQDAQQVLSPTYISTGTPTDRTRPNQAAATALLARVWLYQSEWAQAEQAADSVIVNPLYYLESELDNVFLATSREAIWQLQPVYDSMATAEGSLFIPPAGQRPTYTLTGWLDSSWEVGDQRRVYWTDSVIVNDAVYFYPYKYKLASNNPPNTEYDMVLRLAETYLIRAEARAQQGNSAGAAADLNIIRQRAGLPPTGASSGPDLLAAIAQERRMELFSEWGHRWLDLNRTGQTVTLLGAEKKDGIQLMDILYPIPAVEIIYNPALMQNPGY